MTPLLWALEIAAGLTFIALVLFRLRGGRVVARRGAVVVRRTREHLELWLERGLRATLQGRVLLADPRVSGVAYTDGFFLYPPPAGGSVLFVGLGAGVGPRQLARLYPDVEARAVEADPGVAELCAEHFGLGIPVEIAEGRAHLERDARRYDLIVLDAFGAGTYAGRLATVEAFTLLRERLREPGTLVVNLGGTLGGRLASVYAALRQAFADQVVAHGVIREDGRPFDAARRGNTLAYAFRGTPPAPRGGAVVTPPAAPPLHDAGVAGDLRIE